MKLAMKSQRRPEMVYAYPVLGNCYLNLTNRCTLRCHFCPRLKGEWEVQGYNLRLAREPGAEELLVAVRAMANGKDCKEIVFCGLGEPTLRLQTLLTVGRQLRREGARVRLNTNGLANQLHGYDVSAELGEAVDAISISLNAQNETLYERHCRPLQAGAYASLLAFIQGIREQISEVTVTAIDGLAGVDIEACAGIAADLGVKFRARKLNHLG
jgi:TatD family-associated radical SAM protein